MSTDPFVTDLLNRAVATVEPRTETLLAGGLARGRTLRRRRRIAQGGSGLALAGLITTVAVAAWPASDPAAQPSAAHPTSVLPTSQAVPTVKAPAVQAPADDTETITPQVLLSTALRLLPGAGTTAHYTGRSLPGWVGAEFVYDDGNGAAQVDVAMGFTGDGVQGAQPKCTPGQVTATTSCTLLADGSYRYVFRGPEYPQGHQPDNATQWWVDLVRADGVEVSLTEWNAPQEKDAATTRANPPFSIAELTAIARSDLWTVQVNRADADKVDGLFTPDPTDDPQPAATSAREVAEALRAKQAMNAARKQAMNAARKAAHRAADKAGH